MLRHALTVCTVWQNPEDGIVFRLLLLTTDWPGLARNFYAHLSAGPGFIQGECSHLRQQLCLLTIDNCVPVSIAMTLNSCEQGLHEFVTCPMLAWGMNYRKGVGHSPPPQASAYGCTVVQFVLHSLSCNCDFAVLMPSWPFQQCRYGCFIVVILSARVVELPSHHKLFHHSIERDACLTTASLR